MDNRMLGRVSGAGVCARSAGIGLVLLLASCGGAELAERREMGVEGASGSSAVGPSSDESDSLFDVDIIGDDDRWTTGSERREYAPTDNITVTGIEAAGHDDFDRFVVTLAGEEFPTHQARISRGPATQCGSGAAVELPGDALLLLRLEAARAHDDAGSGTLAARDLEPGLNALLEARMICDFEGQVEWALGIAEATSFRVLELTAPNRIVLDIRHR